MSLPRYVINFDELIDGLFDNNKEQIDIKKGKQYSKGFCIDLQEKNNLEFEIQENMIVNNIVIATPEKSQFGNTNFDLFIENKLGNKINYIFENMYIKNIYENKQMYGYLKLNISDILKIKFNQIDNIRYIFIDIDYLKV